MQILKSCTKIYLNKQIPVTKSNNKKATKNMNATNISLENLLSSRKFSPVLSVVSSEDISEIKKFITVRSVKIK